ncbi:hypothetical protein TSTA_022580 [Talaromyces stipitatus ATCC 10500]|uniref:Uncharacterized protein n=1 Tax=Talaromyces stipitatus (strain ATCC 10500 / CBS 375.48 / QM 6759 / NRRL 1006) TaxID=441959 RepID=B8MI42_TALSN|nr:uncharacterized protein TSTA_022580 [Talaromyces stipitatus ATCC 10500]EED17204.1 hypothetical protein TSTA_022580 [Talaromyces stipitatus ATCC 10500]
MKFCLFLSALASIRAFAWNSDSSTGDDPSSISLAPNGLNYQDVESALVLPFIQHEKRDIRPKCSPRTYAATQKRHFSADTQAANVTLYRRTMTLPDGTDAAAMDRFMLAEEESDLFDAIVWDKDVNGEPEDMATSKFEQFGDKAFSLGTGFLCGYTTLAIISRKGVYTGHYWDSISFSPDQAWIDEYGSAEEAFRRTVILGLTQGVGRNRRIPEQVSLRNQAGKFEDNYIRAYLRIPDTDSDQNPEGYRPQWNAMRNLVNRFVPTLATGDR